ncbi:phiRv2 prophage protein [Mycobacterium tuberculosis]|nr:phiRv2 prophage protein [Mycobacterium tuberculosis]
MTEFDDIKNLSLPETRDAAKQLLDSVAGDLTGEAAQRFQALTRHAEELRAEQRRRGREAEEALRRCRAGELRVVPGAPTGGDDGDAPPGNSLRDTAFRTLDVCVRDGLMSSRAAEAAETLCRTGPPQSTSWAQRWLAATGSRDYLGAFVKRVSNPVAGHTVWTDREAAAWREAAAVAAEQRAGREAEEALRRYRAGELRVVPGAPTGGDDGDAPPGNSLRDTAFRTLDSCVRDGLMSSRAAETAETLCRTGPPQSTSWAQRWLAATGNRDYLGAFVKRVSNPVAGHTTWTDREAAAWREAAAVAAEQRAMGLVDTAGGFLIPAALDPAILLSGDGSTNPIRQVARVVQTTSEVWRGVTSEGAEAHWYSEAQEVSDDSPTLAQPAVPSYRGSCWIPFSLEIEGDAAGFVAEVGRVLADSVEQLQAAAFVSGSGNGEPTGFVSALTGTADYTVTGAGTEAVVAADVYALQSALPPRFQSNSAFAANLSTINVLRQAETANGALKFPSLHASPPMLAGKHIWEVSNMDTVDAAVTATNYPLVLGDWKQFIITDRVGSTVELVPHVFGGNRRPTGQRGFFCWFRVGSDVLVDNAFRVLKVQTTA